MTADDLIKVIGIISDKFVIEYDIATKKKRGKFHIPFSCKWLVAACLTVVMITSLIAQYMNTSNDMLKRKMYIFSSYKEFSAVVTDAKIVKNLSQIDGIELDIYGAFKDFTTEETTRVEDYDFFNVEAKLEKHLFAELILTLDAADKAEKYIDNAALTTVAVINNVPVHYTYDYDAESWDCVVVLNKDYYRIRYFSDDENELIEFLTIVIGR